MDQGRRGALDKAGPAGLRNPHKTAAEHCLLWGGDGEALVTVPAGPPTEKNAASGTTGPRIIAAHRYGMFLLLEAARISFRDMALVGQFRASKEPADGVHLWHCQDVALSRVKVKNFSQAVGGSAPHYSAKYEHHRTDRVVIADCIFADCGHGINWTYVLNSIIKDSEFSGAFNDGVGFNAGSSLHVVARCRCHDNGGDGINTYSNNHFVLHNNVCCNNRTWGIQVQTYTQDVRITGNLCRDNGRAVADGQFTGGGIGIVTNSATIVPRDIVILNNVISGNKGHGIAITPPRGGGPITRAGGPFHISIVSNNIAQNKGDGIVNAVNAFEIAVRGNLIADNGGFGVNQLNQGSTLLLSENDVWRNAEGNYNGCEPGAGDVSAAPWSPRGAPNTTTP